MKPIKFKQQNTVYGAGKVGMKPVPAFKDIATIEKGVVICWSMGLWKRIKFLFTGKIYVATITYGESIYPTKLSTEFINPTLQEVLKNSESNE